MAERTDELGLGEERPLGQTERVTEQGKTDEDDPAAIRAEIRETRERMSDTLEQLGERLNPRHLKEQVKHDIREATIGRVETMARSAADRVNDTRRSITDVIRENPIPAAMVGVGLGWLYWNSRSQGSQLDGSKMSRGSWQAGGTLAGRSAGGYSTGYGGGAGGRAGASGGYGSAGYRTGYGSGSSVGGYTGDSEGAEGTLDRVRDRAGDIGDTVKEKASDFGGSVKEKAGALAGRAQEVAGNVADRAQQVAGTVADRAQEMAGSVADQTRYQARRLEDQFYEHPLAIGAAAIALGLAAGLAVPETRKETELMGDARDQLVDRVREVAGETKDKVQHVAERVFDQVQTTAKDAAREEGLTS
jgi:ElaB/YqjD/DUF883 family membrane-anchored ribosome-binding protein